eukprot:411443-Pelagomonas_calceolata.AAC.2
MTVILGALYINPISQHFPVRAVTDSFSSLLDEVARVTRISPHVLLCGDLICECSEEALIHQHRVDVTAKSEVVHFNSSGSNLP